MSCETKIKIRWGADAPVERIAPMSDVRRQRLDDELVLTFQTLFGLARDCGDSALEEMLNQRIGMYLEVGLIYECDAKRASTDNRPFIRKLLAVAPKEAYAFGVLSH